VSGDGSLRLGVDLAQRISAELAEYAMEHDPERAQAGQDRDVTLLSPDDELLAEYDRRIADSDLRAATRSRFVSKHYADAVEAGVKTLNECVRARTARTEDGDQLMTIAFSSNGALLRINKGRSKSDESAQRGHMYLCQGVIGAWRNPRAHTLVADSPVRTLMMLELINDLVETTKAATRTRKRKKP